MANSNQQLRELVDSLHPRSPKEVMGEAASSSLLSSTVTAALSTVGLILGLTVIVFIVGGGPEQKTEAAATTTPAAAAEPTPAEPAAPAEPSKPDAAATEKADTEGAVEAMGIGDSKDPDSAPETLENRLDQLLDGLE
jgi:hypothetical protein